MHGCLGGFKEGPEASHHSPRSDRDACSTNHVLLWLFRCQQCRTLLRGILCQGCYEVRAHSQRMGWRPRENHKVIAKGSQIQMWLYTHSLYTGQQCLSQRCEFKQTLMLLWLIKCTFIWKLHWIDCNALPLHSSWVKIQILSCESLRKVLIFNSFSQNLQPVV